MREHLQEGFVDLEFVQSRNEFSDILRKRARNPPVESFVDSVILRDTSYRGVCSMEYFPDIAVEGIVNVEAFKKYYHRG